MIRLEEGTRRRESPSSTWISAWHDGLDIRTVSADGEAVHAVCEVIRARTRDGETMRSETRGRGCVELASTSGDHLDDFMAFICGYKPLDGC